jgi:hypothetical protein
MKFNSVTILVLAVACGVVGGLLSSKVYLGSIPDALQSNVVLRASRIELIDSDRRTRAVLSMDKYDREASLSFITMQGDIVASFGVGATLPFIKLMGVDGEPRAELRLNQFEQPSLSMGDEYPGVRLKLGTFDLDDGTRGSAWGLALHSGLLSTAASITMNRESEDHPYAGFLRIANPAGSFNVPQK